MGRLCLVFAALLLLSAMSLVTARFQSRQLFVASDRLDASAHELNIEWRRLQLERAELARNGRIDRIARDELKMVSTTPDRTIYIKGSVVVPSEPLSAGGQP